jgi:chlorobactene glucosyltransferase
LDAYVLLSTFSALSILAFFSFRLGRNLQFLRWADRQLQLPETPPCVSVLIPARNEAANISACVESLLAQDYPLYHVAVLNDQSTDSTGAQLDRLAGNHPRLQVIHGDSAPPPRWNGKSCACHRLAQRAEGEWLLFTDADTVHTPQSITSGIARAQALGVDLLSVFPYQRTGSWSEWLMVPFILGFLVLVGLDFRALWRGRSTRVAANGQYLLVRAEAYRAVGGHAAVYDSLVDDFALAQRFYTGGYRIALVNGAAMLNCRMYRNAREVWQGFTKNLLLALGTTQKFVWWQIPIFAWGYAAVFISPYLFLLQSGLPLALLTVGWLWTLRAIVARYLSRSVLEAPVVSLAALGVMALSFNALYLRLRGKGIIWKARHYA